MKCPDCSSVLRTKDTRQYRDYDGEYDWVERRKVCPACTYTVQTVEVPKDVYARLFNRREGQS